MRQKKRKKVICAYKRVLQNDHDWDYTFLLVLEQKKLMRMANYFSNTDITTTDAQVAKDLKLCVRLLDIILNCERHTRIWSSKVVDCIDMHFWKNPDGKTSKLEFEYKGMIPDFPKYVNTRNACRFIKSPVNYNIDEPEKERKYNMEHYKERLRKAKAWHLYNLVRECRMFNWWD